MADRNVIEIDISDAIKGMDSIQQKSSDPHVLMDTLADILLEGVQQNFDNEQGPDGSWPELSESTQEDRKRKGYGAKHPMLIRTRQLESSLQPRSSTDEAHVTTNKIYAPLQFLGGRPDMPAGPASVAPRNPMWINPATDREIDAEVDDWFDD